MVLAYAKDAYLYGHLDVTQAVLAENLDLVNTYLTQPAWGALPEQWRLELKQMRGDMQTLLFRIASNLDYFGNPAGWVPMLSFEANMAAFENETDLAIRMLYLSYWIRNQAQTVQQKVNALTSGREKMNEEIERFKSEFNRLSEMIPRLQVDIVNIDNERQYVLLLLQQREEELLRRAEQNVKGPFWKQALRFIGGVCSVIPVVQPALGVIGAGLSTLSKINSSSPWDFIKNLPNLDSEKFKKYESDFDVLNSKISSIPQVISTNNVITYINDIQNVLPPVRDHIEKYENEILQKTQVDKGEVTRELDRLKATDPEFQELTKRTKDLLEKREKFFREWQDATQGISTLESGITHDLLAIDGMNRDISNGNAVLDHRAMVYLQEMERRAKERLLKYHYYMAKAFEFRILRPYPGELKLDTLFSKFRDIAVAGSGHELSAGDFETLKGLYEDQVSAIASDIFDTYNSTPPARTAPVRWRLSADHIRDLNEGKSIVINPMNIGVFNLSEENIRIVNLQVYSIQVHPEGGNYDMFAYVDLKMQHSGLSKLTADGKIYQFAHHNNSTLNPITWGAGYDGISNRLDMTEPSAANESLIRALLTREGRPTEDLLLYSRPAAWADIVITKNVETNNGISMIIDSLVLELMYDFTSKRPEIASLNVKPSEDGLMPLFILNTVDLNGRQDGVGDLYRSYSRGTSLTVEAPSLYGVWKFEKWTDSAGTTIGTSRVLNLNLSSDKAIRAHFAQDQTQCTYSIMPDYSRVGATAGSGIVSVTTGNECGWSGVSSDPSWLTVDPRVAITGGGDFRYQYTANSSAAPRIGTITVANKTFTLTQAGFQGCTFILEPTWHGFGSTGGDGRSSVTSPAGCGWTASTLDSWITITSPPGTGNGTVNFNVSSYVGSVSRSGQITVEGHPVTVTQSASCSRQPVKLVSTSNYYSSIATAYDMAQNNEIIEVQGIPFIGNFLFDLDRVVMLMGGFDCDFGTNLLQTTISGSLTITGGTVEVENILIE